MAAEEFAAFGTGMGEMIAGQYPADAPGVGLFPEPAARGGADASAAAGRGAPSVDDAHDPDAVGAGAVQPGGQPPQGFLDRRQAGFEIEMAQFRSGGAGAGGGTLRGLAVGTDRGVGGDGFAAGVAGLHGAAGGSGARREKRRSWRPTTPREIRKVSVSEAGAA